MNCFGSTILRPKAVTLPLLLLIALRIKKENGCVFVDGIEFTEFRWHENLNLYVHIQS